MTDVTASSRSRAGCARARLRRTLPAVALVAVAALVVRAVGGGSAEIGHSLRLLSHPAPGWLCLAIAAEAASFLAYAAAQRRLAGAAGARPAVGWLASLAVAAQALNNFLPVGYLAANVLNFRQLSRRELSGPLAAWLLVATSVLYIGVLAALALVGSLIAGGGGGTVAADLRTASLGVLGVLLLLGISVGVAARSGGLRRLRSAVAGAAQRRGGRAAAALDGVRGFRSQLSSVRLSRSVALSAAGLFLVSWLADAACLTCGFAALGVAPPWTSLLMAYSAAQLVAFLPITPGGLGLVEGSLTVALATGSTAGAGTILAGVLLYRGISYWATLPAGLAGYLNLRRSGSLRALPAQLLGGPEAAAPPIVGVALETAVTP